MTTIQTKNPYTGTVIKDYKYFTELETNNCLQNAAVAAPVWSVARVEERCELLKNVANLLFERKQKFAQLITSEMGKPISQSLSEIQKCVAVCDFYIENASQFLADSIISSVEEESFISYDPLGIILGIMPWNYPFWQAIRFAVPTLTAGNVVILKHAENVTGSALALEQLFKDAGYAKGCLQIIRTPHAEVKNIIADDTVRGVSFTGSTTVGREIGQISGKNLKKTVLELGGSNACIVWEDADLDIFIDVMVRARMQNNGQSCIAAKRFIVVEDIYQEFIERLKTEVSKLKIGDPNDADTDVSVMARADLAETLHEQLRKSVAMGAKVVLGNKREGTFFTPTILTEVTEDMPVFKQETFGPVAAICKVPNRQAAIDLSAKSAYGLGTMLFTQDIAEARKVVEQIPDGAFFINEMVQSNPQLPFGGTKNSGYGRELSLEGILAFVNKKTVYIKKN